jgi:hypothetical protein
MKKSNPQILCELFDSMIQNGQTHITGKEIVKQTGIQQAYVTWIIQNLKRDSKYRIVATLEGGNKPTYCIGRSTNFEQLTNAVIASTNAIQAWRNIAQKPDKRLYIPAFWPAPKLESQARV